MFKKILFILFSLSYSILSTSQDIQIKGYFGKDSIQLGEPLPYVLSINYPKNLEFTFPDSLYDFSPFEFISKVYFPTYSDNKLSHDSVIYYLTTFEIDTIQYLKLPLYKINEYDSNILWSSVDSIFLNQVIITLPDSISMRVNTDYQEVNMAFNYPYAIIGFIFSTIIITLFWVFFNKKIRKKIKIYHLKKQHKKFMNTFDQFVKKDHLTCIEILALWKSYLEKLDIITPYSKLTTKEILSIVKNNDLKLALVAIDKNIYGPKDESLLAEAYQSIKKIAMEKYTTKINSILNGYS